MKAYVDEQTAQLRDLVALQRQTIQAQAERLAAVEAMFAQPQASVIDLKRRIA
jgi:hypothetical protein